MTIANTKDKYRLGINLKFEHQLDFYDSVSRIKRLLPELQKEYSRHVSNVMAPWIGSGCDFFFTVNKVWQVSGLIEVGEGVVYITAKIPLAAIMFKGMIELEISERTKKLLK